MINSSPQVKYAYQLQEIADNSPQVRGLIQKKELKQQGNLQNQPIQRYTDIDTKKITNGKNLGSTARVADNGKTATSNDYSHVCYADKGLIGHANDILKAKESGIEITKGADTITVDAPNGKGTKTLTKVNPKIKTSTSTTGTQNFWTDCGRSSREVMGKTGTDTYR